MGRFRRIVSFAAVDAEDEEDVAKDRLAGTKAYNGIISVGEFRVKWEHKKEFVSELVKR
jgi:hypothetical protein